MTIMSWLKQVVGGSRLESPQASIPISIPPLSPEADRVPPGGGLEVFESPEAIKINRARMMHLASLGLPPEGSTVLDVGCGVGHLGHFLSEQRRCKVTCVDGREENIRSLRARYPDLAAHVADVEGKDLSQFGMFDVVFCYGLLYHLENPLAGFRNMAAACQSLLLLETLICDQILPVLRLTDEPRNFNQAIRGLGCRPSPSYVVQALNRIGFPFVYAPADPPEHPDFRFAWRNNLDAMRDGHPIRCVFIASRTRLADLRIRPLWEQ